MPDEEFNHPRLAAIYDALDPVRDDLDAYVDIAVELGARTVLDVGCGTGVLALLLAANGITVTAVDPALGSIDVARSKPDASAVRWIHGDARALPPLSVDLVTMTGNTAQAIVDPTDWADTLAGMHDSMRRGGHVVLETRLPADRAWTHWNRDASFTRTRIPQVGDVDSWVDVLDVSGPLVTFRWTWQFAADGAVLTSDSTIRFRTREEMMSDLQIHGLRVVEVREAPDRPSREMVFLATRDT